MVAQTQAPVQSQDSQAPAELQDQSAIWIKLDDIIPDPKQPRKTFNQGYLNDLAVSIKLHQVIQPITVRYSFEHSKYMIVFGECRWRSSVIVNNEIPSRIYIPAFVRALNDDEVLELQVIENLQREDIHAIQEAHAFSTLHHRLSIDEIADRIGKSKQYVSTRLRLNELLPLLQEIFQAGKMALEDAKALSRATKETQELVITESTRSLSWQSESWHIRNYLYLLKKSEQNLDLAKFDTEDPELNPAMGACGQCPHNSACNQLFGDVEGRICNLSACFKIKTERAYEQRLKAAAATPGVLLIAESHYDEVNRNKVKVAETVAGNVLKAGSWNEVSIKGERPTWNDFYKEQKEDFEEGNDEALFEKQTQDKFKEEVQEWEEGQAVYDQALLEGRIKQAFVVAGTGEGSYKTVVLTKDATDSLTGDISAKIEKLLQKEREAQDEDVCSVYRKSTLLLQNQPAFIENTQPPNTEETIALAILLSDRSHELRVWLAAQTQFETEGTLNKVKLYDHLLEKLTPEIMNRFIRVSLLNGLYAEHAANPTTNVDARALMNVATHYFKNEVLAIQQVQNRAAILRGTELNEKITNLRLSFVLGTEEKPLPIRTERTRMIIKFCPPDSNSGWRKLEGPFQDMASMNSRFNELLATNKYFEEPELVGKNAEQV